MKTILVIDDFSSARLYHSSLIRRMGHQAVEAADVHSARDILATQKIDLVLLDLLMPHGDGRLLIDKTVPPIIVVTSESERYGASGLSALPVKAVLNKPVLPATLQAAIAAAIGGPN